MWEEGEASSADGHAHPPTPSPTHTRLCVCVLYPACFPFSFFLLVSTPFRVLLLSVHRKQKKQSAYSPANKLSAKSLRLHNPSVCVKSWVR